MVVAGVTLLSRRLLRLRLRLLLLLLLRLVVVVVLLLRADCHMRSRRGMANRPS